MYYVITRHLQLAWSYPGCHPLKMLFGVDPFLNLLEKDAMVLLRVSSHKRAQTMLRFWVSHIP